MKRIININLSKDTPTETLTALYAALKTEKKPKRKQSELYLSNEDIEKLHARYEELFKQVKNSLNLSEQQIEKECDTLSRKYDFELEQLSKLRKVDYDKWETAIKAREKEETPWRRCWLWRLLFQPLTNRAQDIIEDRAELEADIIHTAAEKAIEDERKKLPPDDDKKLSKRKLKRLMRDKLKAVIKQADKADTNEAFTEPENAGTAVPPVEPVQKNAGTAAPMHDVEPAPVQEQPPQKQLPGQMTLDDVQKIQLVHARRPRPPRSCRR